MAVADNIASKKCRAHRDCPVVSKGAISGVRIPNESSCEERLKKLRGDTMLYQLMTESGGNVMSRPSHVNSLSRSLHLDLLVATYACKAHPWNA